MEYNLELSSTGSLSIRSGAITLGVIDERASFLIAAEIIQRQAAPVKAAIAAEHASAAAAVGTEPGKLIRLG